MGLKLYRLRITVSIPVSAYHPWYSDPVETDIIFLNNFIANMKNPTFSKNKNP